MNIFVIGVTYHEFIPGNDYISLNKETTIQIQSMHKEYTHHSVMRKASTTPEGTQALISECAEWLKSLGYMINRPDDCDTKTWDDVKYKNYVEFDVTTVTIEDIPNGTEDQYDENKE